MADNSAAASISQLRSVQRRELLLKVNQSLGAFQILYKLDISVAKKKRYVKSRENCNAEGKQRNSYLFFFSYPARYCFYEP